MMIDSTSSPREAAARDWDAVVIGAGPAGSTCALGLARRGLAVLLIDKRAFPRAKVCGACINRRAQSVLEALGMGELLDEENAGRLHRMRLAVAGHAIDLALDGYRVLSRARLDARLARAAIDAGAAFLAPARVHPPGIGTGGRALEIVVGERTLALKTKCVIAADGLAGSFTAGLRRSEAGRARGPGREGFARPGSRIGAGAVCEDREGACPAGMLRMAVGRGGYVGLVRQENGRLNCAAALDPEHVRGHGGAGRAAAAILDEAGVEGAEAIGAAEWRGTPTLTRRGKAAYPGVFVVGDAAGYIEPFTGEGMAWAMCGGLALVPIAVEAARKGWSEALAAEWTARHRERVGKRQLACHAVAAMLRHPALLRGAMHILAAWPGLVGPIMRRLNEPIPQVERVPQ